MTQSKYYETDPDDPDAPVVLDEYNGLRAGDRVRYTASIPMPDEETIIDEIIEFGDGDVMAVLLVGNKEPLDIFEVDADNLTKHDEPPSSAYIIFERGYEHASIRVGCGPAVTNTIAMIHQFTNWRWIATLQYDQLDTPNQRRREWLLSNYENAEWRIRGRALVTDAFAIMNERITQS